MTNVIDILEERGFIEATTHEEIRDHFDTPRAIYCGFDPTSDSLHLGNLVAIIGLAWFQRFGHTPVAVVGGATGLIGDPSGKSHERPLLSKEQLQVNLQGIRKNIETVLSHDEAAKPVILNNHDWFEGISFLHFLRDVGKQFRMGPMLSKDSVRSRLESEEGMSYTEFSYQLLQAYDFLYLHEHHDVTAQIGGADQWGNITAGIDLMKKKGGKTGYGITFPLLTRSDGKKFGKSEKGAIWLSGEKLSPYEFYQYLFRIPDEDVIPLMHMLTFLEMEEIQKIEQEMKSDRYETNSAQKRLASEVTKMIHGAQGLEKALAVTSSAKPGAKTQLDSATLEALSEEIPCFDLNDFQEGCKLIDVVAELKVTSSKGEIRRLIQNGGAYLNNEKLSDPQMLLVEGNFVDGKYLLLALGKKNKVIIRRI